MENLLNGNKGTMILGGLLIVAIFLIIRGHNEIKKLRSDLSIPMPEPSVEDASEMG